MNSFAPDKSARRSILAGILRGMRLGGGIALTLGLVFLLFASLALGAFFSMSQLRERNALLAQSRLPRLETTLTVERETYEAMLNLTAYALSGDEAEYSGARQNLARIKEAAANLDQLAAYGPMRQAGQSSDLSASLESLHEQIARLDLAAEETRNLNAERANSWRNFNTSLAAMDQRLRELAKNASSAPRDISELQNDFHALRAAISTSLVSGSGGSGGSGGAGSLTLRSLETDFSRFADRVLNLQTRQEEAAANAAENSAGEAGNTLPGAEEQLPEPPDLAALPDAALLGLSTLIDNLDTAGNLDLQRRDAASRIALIAREISRESLNDVRSGLQTSALPPRTMLPLSLIGITLTALLCIFLFLLCLRRIIRPLSELTIFTRQAADGESTSTLDFHSEDELGELANALRTLVGSQRENMARIRRQSRETELQRQAFSVQLEKSREALRFAGEREQDLLALLEALREKDKLSQSLLEISENSRETENTPAGSRETLRDLADLSISMRGLVRKLKDAE